jgi:hypothetical protein
MSSVSIEGTPRQAVELIAKEVTDTATDTPDSDSEEEGSEGGVISREVCTRYTGYLAGDRRRQQRSAHFFRNEQRDNQCFDRKNWREFAGASPGLSGKTRKL